MLPGAEARENALGVYALVRPGDCLRALPESNLQVRPSLLPYVAAWVCAFVIGALVLGRIADTQCGFKGFRREVARDLFSRFTLRGFAFDVERRSRRLGMDPGGNGAG